MISSRTNGTSQGPVWLGFLDVFGALRIFEVWKKRAIPLVWAWKDMERLTKTLVWAWSQHKKAAKP